MVIAVMVSLSEGNARAADRLFFNRALLHLLHRRGQHHYYICTDAPGEVNIKEDSVNVVHATYINKVGFGRLLRRVQHRKLLKKVGAEAVLYFGLGQYIRNRLPYYLLVKPSDMKEGLSRKVVRAIAEAQSVWVLSEAAKSSICQQNKVAPEKVSVVYTPAGEDFRPANAEQHAEVKERFTEGREYFIYTGSFEDQKAMIHLLKAFSLFKKRQKTNWKLVMVNRERQPAARFLEAVRTYKYREDIVIVEKEGESLPALLGAAYAFVYPDTWEDYGLYVLEAMHCGQPVIIPESKLLKELAGDAGIYYNNSVEDVAEKMMAVYKDETMRSQQIGKVNERIRSFLSETDCGVVV